MRVCRTESGPWDTKNSVIIAIIFQEVRKMRKRAFAIFVVIAALPTVTFCGNPCAAAEAGKEPAARTILL